MALVSALDRYRNISRLGAGGMATVWLAEDLVLGRKVALKRVAGAGVGDLGPLATDHEKHGGARLRREALLGASVSHPNLVSIYDVLTTDNGDVVIVMEYVPGETLQQRLARDGQLAPRAALPIMEGVAAGLDAIHGRGIVHRDVKPANVLLGDDGAVKLGDLGLATMPDRTRITSAGTVLGTFRYMAPEQLNDGPAAPAADVYALAVVAFEMLAGQKARPESTPMAVAHALATQPPADLRAAWPAAPPAAAAVLMRAMDRDPTRRPRSAGELVARLSAALEPEPTEELRSPPPSPARRERATHPPAIPAAVPLAAAAGPVRRPTTDPRPAPVVRRSPPPRSTASPANGGRRRPSASASSDAVARRRLPAIAALAALAAAAAVAVAIALISSSSSPSKRGPTDHTATARAATGRPRAVRAASRQPAGAHSTAAASPSGTSGAAAPGSEGGASGASTPSPTPIVPVATGAGTASDSPVSAVESFYHLAAEHRYADAWGLADPTFQSQLGGYASFAAGQSGDRSISFSSARVLSDAGSAATVAVQTTSVRDTGTQQCAGTVDLRAGTGGTWLLHLIHITCS